ncbi:MAG: hypothetical protein BGN87_15140 [Rhizobiales bacterium 65-79]|nr:hypothetical protein [Hyphomicrobiales bacterium]OJU05320.1 MAG: hypothetical protein BGN87_15140 [Rhizobiales bacterium 65-79]
MSTCPEDWRITNAEHLKGQRLHFRKYTRWSDTWDHDHCAACGARFAEGKEPDIQHEGYATGNDYPKGAGYDWVCKQCFDDLTEEMQWSAAPDPGVLEAK